MAMAASIAPHFPMKIWNAKTNAVMNATASAALIALATMMTPFPPLTAKTNAVIPVTAMAALIAHSARVSLAKNAPAPAAMLTIAPVNAAPNAAVTVVANVVQPWLTLVLQKDPSVK